MRLCCLQIWRRFYLAVKSVASAGITVGDGRWGGEHRAVAGHCFSTGSRVSNVSSLHQASGAPRRCSPGIIRRKELPHQHQEFWNQNQGRFDFLFNHQVWGDEQHLLIYVRAALWCPLVTRPLLGGDGCQGCRGKLIFSPKAPRVRISSQFSIFSAYIHTNNYISLCTIHRTDTKVWFWSSMCTHTISFIKVQFILQIYIFDISFLCDLIQE